MKLIKGTFLFLLCLIADLAVGQVSPGFAGAQPIDKATRVVLRGNVHPLARNEFDRGLAPDNLPQQCMLMLMRRSPEQESALQHFLDEQQTKSSPNYHKWLSPEEFGTRFGPADAQVQNVTAWLTAGGFQVNRISAAGNVIEFSGTAGQVRNAFSTEIHQFVVNGESHWANAADPQIPAALGSAVQGVVSLNNFPRRTLSRTLGVVQRSPLTGELVPSFTFSPSGKKLYGLGPADFATIYNVQPLWNSGIDGTGQTIAIVAESNINVSDIQSFRSLFGLPPNSPQIIVNGPDPGLIQGAETEAVADVEWSGAVAKNATIDLVVSAPTETTPGIDLSALYIVENNLAPVVSMSFGDCEATLGASENAFYNELWRQAAAQGMTVIVAAGDNLSAGCDSPNSPGATGLAVSGAASTPYNIAVGGTDFDQASSPTTYWNGTSDPVTGASAKFYIPEMTWNASCAAAGLSGCANGGGQGNSGGSGGQSSIYTKPAWQTGPGVPQDGKRDLPDLSLFAAEGNNLSSYLICEADQDPNNAACSLNSTAPELLAVGGTSISAQAFAGVMALVNQYQLTHGHAARQGNANYVLYQLAAQSNLSCSSSTASLGTSSCVFYDVTKGNNSAECSLNAPNCGGPGTGFGVLVDPSNPNTPAWTATPGFDLATGLGSINVQNLAANWAGVVFTPTATNLTISPTTITHGQPVTINAMVSPNPGSGTPTGDVSLVGNRNGTSLGMGLFTLTIGAVTNQTFSSLAGGSYSVVAHYAGDGVYAASDSNPVSVTVNPEPSKTLLRLVTFHPSTGQITNSNATSAPYGSPYILRMDVGNASLSLNSLCSPTNLLSCPTGSINLSADGAPLDAGMFKLNLEGFTEDSTIQLAGGSHSLTAQYSGDGSYLASNAAGTITITPAPTEVFASSTSGCCLLVGSQVTVSVSVSANSNGVAPTGTVTLFDNGSQTPSASATLSSGSTSGHTGSAGASATVSLKSPGFHNFQVRYSGDQNYAAGTGFYSVEAQIKPTVTISANPQTVAYPGTTTVTAVVHTGQKSPQPTDSMGFLGIFGTNQSSATYTNITDPDGTAALQLTQTFTPIVNSDVSGAFFGDTNYQQANSSAVHITVTGAPDFSVSAAPASLSLGSGQSVTSTVTETQLNGFTGQVSLSCNVQNNVRGLSCAVSPNSVTAGTGGTATATVTITAAQTVAQSSNREKLGLLSLVFASGMFLIPWRGGRRNVVPGLLALVAISLVFVSCGGGGNSATPTPTPTPPPQPQTYSVNVTGTTSLLNQVGVSHTATISVTMQ